MIPIKFGMSWMSNNFTVLVSVYYKDGSVAITHGGIEMGQGINTKVRIQGCRQKASYYRQSTQSGYDFADIYDNRI